MAKPKIVYFKPGGVVRGVQVYLDANFLVGLAWPGHIWHHSAQALRDFLAGRGTKLVLSSLAFNEAIYQLTRLAEKEGAATDEDAAPAPVVSALPSASDEPGESDQQDEADLVYDEDEDEDEADALDYRNVARYSRTSTRRPVSAIEPTPKKPGWAELLEAAVLTLPNLTYFEPPDAEFHRQVIRGVHDLKLDPTDSFHYSAARRLNCPLVSNDVGFQKIPDQNLVIVTFF